LREKVGQQSRLGVAIYDIHDLKKIARREGIRIAVIAVPAPSAQHVLNLVVAAGVKAVLNFSPGTLQPPPGGVEKTGGGEGAGGAGRAGLPADLSAGAQSAKAEARSAKAGTGAALS